MCGRLVIYPRVIGKLKAVALRTCACWGSSASGRMVVTVQVVGVTKGVVWAQRARKSAFNEILVTLLITSNLHSL